jgi:hypothetical protein
MDLSEELRQLISTKGIHHDHRPESKPQESHDESSREGKVVDVLSLVGPVKGNIPVDSGLGARVVRSNDSWAVLRLVSGRRAPAEMSPILETDALRRVSRASPPMSITDGNPRGSRRGQPSAAPSKASMTPA